MSNSHPFGSTMADLSAALALSKKELEEEAEFGLIHDSFFSIFSAPAIVSYLDKHCGTFAELEENTFECTTIHKGYKELVDTCLDELFADLAVSPEQFEAFCQRCFQGGLQVHQAVVEQLLGIDDFSLFKKMMLDRKAQLCREDPAPRLELAEVSDTNAAAVVAKKEPEHPHESSSLPELMPLLPAVEASMAATPVRAEFPGRCMQTPETESKGWSGQGDEYTQHPPGKSTQAFPPAKTFSLFKQADHLALGEVDVPQVPATLDFRPKPWPTALAPAVIKAAAQSQGTSEHDYQARADFWRTQKEILLRKKKAEELGSPACRAAGKRLPSPVAARRNAGQRLVAELTATPKPLQPEVLDAAEARRTLMRQLRKTFRQ